MTEHKTIANGASVLQRDLDDLKMDEAEDGTLRPIITNQRIYSIHLCGACLLQC